MTYAFRFDARYCSGCKACQAACKDKNNLPPGVLWRRVYEVSGGEWGRDGEAWKNSVFAYNFSLSCNHCVHPKCAGVCPTNAYEVRPDGIVYLDTAKCIGCGYCSWACPYSAPQYNPAAGHMSKCDFCFDQLEQGLPPACVAACPMRVLDYGEMTAPGNGLALWETSSEAHPYPLPVFSRTQPRLLIKPHPAMNGIEAKSVANLEEIHPRTPSNFEELPLILFTLLVQMAVGGYWAMTWIFPPLWGPIQYDETWLRLLPALMIGACLAIGTFTSFAHLGTKKNAWRILANLRRSSISKEILFLGLFGISWLFTVLDTTFWNVAIFEMTAMATIFGIGLIYNMAQVYRIPAAPAWNTWRTNVGFLVSALLLGVSAMAPLLAYESIITGIYIPAGQWTGIGGSILALLLIQLGVMSKQSIHLPLWIARTTFILIGVVISAAGLLLPNLYIHSYDALIAVSVIIEEVIGRWVFYQSRTYR